MVHEILGSLPPSFTQTFAEILIQHEPREVVGELPGRLGIVQRPALAKSQCALGLPVVPQTTGTPSAHRSTMTSPKGSGKIDACTAMSDAASRFGTSGRAPECPRCR